MLAKEVIVDERVRKKSGGKGNYATNGNENIRNGKVAGRENKGAAIDDGLE